ncbi:MAG TPA: chemotaxis protein CheW [Gammaproteobacteria bacterium]|nr:chemotaxis protein CheW [Gammaproteobacteria bacterium]
MSDERELYCLLLPLGGGKLLLPRRIVEEVRGLVPPTPVPGAPAWLLGCIPWRDGRIPLLAMEPLLDARVPDSSRRSRMVIVRAPATTLKPPAIAILTQGFPYILRVTPTLLGSSFVPRHEALLAELNLGFERPVIPDLPALAEEAVEFLAARG